MSNVHPIADVHTPPMATQERTVRPWDGEMRVPVSVMGWEADVADRVVPPPSYCCARKVTPIMRGSLGVPTINPELPA